MCVWGGELWENSRQVTVTEPPSGVFGDSRQVYMSGALCNQSQDINKEFLAVIPGPLRAKGKFMSKT